MTATVTDLGGGASLTTLSNLPTPDDKGRIDSADIVRWALSSFLPAVDQHGNNVLIDIDTGRASAFADAEPVLRAALWHAAEIVLPERPFADAMRTVAATASKERVVTAQRVARRDGVVWLDLGPENGVITITSEYWAKEASPHPDRPYFLPSPAPLPLPQAGGNRAELAEVLGLDEDSAQFRALWGWLVAAVLLPDAPRPILWALGEPGSAKSVRTKVATSVLDPVTALGAWPGRVNADLELRAASSYILTLDDVPTSRMGAEVAKFLTRLVTGTTVQRRVLYENTKMHTLFLKRATAVTSIDLPAGTAQDVLQRTVTVHFRRVSGRTEAEVDAAFAAAHPRTLGALLDDAVAVLAARPEVPVELHRLGEYHLTHLALEGLTGAPYAAEFISGTEMTQTLDAAEEPVVQALLTFLDLRDGEAWEGTNSDLLAQLTKVRTTARLADHDGRWPQSGQSLSRRLNEWQFALGRLGVETFTRLPERTFGRDSGVRQRLRVVRSIP